MDDAQNQQNNQQKPQETTLVQFPSGNIAPATQQVTQVQQSPQPVIQEPVVPTGAVNKEVAPLPSTQAEWVTPSEKTPELAPEIEQTGVAESSAQPKISVEEKIAGLEQAKESAPVASAPAHAIKYPITPEQAEQTVKGALFIKNSSNAMLWLAMLLLRQFKMKAQEKNKEE